MAKKTIVRKLKGKIMIKKGTVTAPPVIVYVSHYIPEFGEWEVYELNADAEHQLTPAITLIDFNFVKYNQMLIGWKMDNLLNQREKLKEQLQEWE